MRAVGLQAYLAAFGLSAPVAVAPVPQLEEHAKTGDDTAAWSCIGKARASPRAGHVVVPWLVHILCPTQTNESLSP